MTDKQATFILDLLAVIVGSVGIIRRPGKWAIENSNGDVLVRRYEAA